MKAALLLVALSSLVATTVCQPEDPAVQQASYFYNKNGDIVARIDTSLVTRRVLSDIEQQWNTKEDRLMKLIITNELSGDVKVVDVASDGDVLDKFMKLIPSGQTVKEQDSMTIAPSLAFSAGEDKQTDINVELAIPDKDGRPPILGTVNLLLKNLPKAALIIKMVIKSPPTTNKTVVKRLIIPESEPAHEDDDSDEIVVDSFSVTMTPSKSHVEISTTPETSQWYLSWNGAESADISKGSGESIKDALNDAPHSAHLGTFLAQQYKKSYLKKRDYIDITGVGKVFLMDQTEKSAKAVVAVCKDHAYVLDFKSEDSVSRYYDFNMKKGVGQAVVLANNGSRGSLGICLCCEGSDDTEAKPSSAPAKSLRASNGGTSDADLMEVAYNFFG